MWSLLFFLILVTFAYTGLSLAPWVPTNSKDLERINTLAKLAPGQRFLEIGCGDGKVCHAIAKMNPSVEVVGVELSPVMFCIAQLRSIFSPQKNLRILFKDLYRVPFKDFDVIYVFGLPDKMNFNLKRKFESELKSGAKVLSYAFEISEWSGNHSKSKPEGKLAIFVYEK